MKTIEDIQAALAGKTIITDLADLLRRKDAAFAESEQKYRKAVARFRTELPAEQQAGLDAYLDACESDVISAVAYAGYLGFRVNLENFHHPVGVDFVHLDTIDYRKDHLFGHFPVNDQNARVREAFSKGVTPGFRGDYEDICDYFIHLECAGPKLAHYAGYVIGNHLLPWVEPGYRPDVSQTNAFAAETEKYMGFLPL